MIHWLQGGPRFGLREGGGGGCWRELKVDNANVAILRQHVGYEIVAMN